MPGPHPVVVLAPVLVANAGPNNMSKIPQELRDLKQWVSFDIELVDGQAIKTPYIPGTTRHASPTDPDHWRTFDEAAAHGHPAFALTKGDPYVFIDFDALKPKKNETDEALAARQEEANAIFEGIESTFVSYMERSVSGNGVHIIGKGVLDGQGTQRKEYGLELYDTGRFVIFTGDTVLDAPVSSFPEADLLKFERWMRKEDPDGGPEIGDLDDEEQEETLTDEEVIEKACKFERIPFLLAGEWQREGFNYPSQSDADFDLIAELWRAGRNTPQVDRIFKDCGLYRAKKVADYVWRAVKRVKTERKRVANEMSRLKASFPAPAPAPSAPANKPAPTKRLKVQKVIIADDFVEVEKDDTVDSLTGEEPETFERLVKDLPPGLLRDMTAGFYSYAHYPLFESALAGALSLCHTIFCRSYQTSTGLALKGWLVLVGPTGSGKETATKGPQELLRVTGVPSVFDLLRGEPRSEQGLFRMLTENNRLLLNVDECAAWLRTMCDPKAPACPAALREALTKLYSKGDEHGMFFSTEKSEKAEKTVIKRPCVNILGDSQAHNLYSGLSHQQIMTGFLPRFLFIDIDPESVALDAQEKAPMPARLVMDTKEALTHCGIHEARGLDPIKVPVDKTAAQALTTYEKNVRRALFSKDEVDDEGNIFKMLHSRSAAKTAIYAALLAVCENWKTPRVTNKHMEWAMRFVHFSTQNTIQNLTGGDFSSDPKEQRKAVVTALRRGMEMTPEARERSQYFGSEALINTPHAVPVSWVRNAVCRLSCFKNDRRDVAQALKSVLAELEEDGEYTVINKKEALTHFQSRCPVVCLLTDEYWAAKAENPDE